MPVKPQATTLDQWTQAATHYPLLPSGVRVGIKIPDLAALAENGTIPNDLIEVALGVASGEDTKPSIELIKQQREFTDLLVMQTVVEPKLDAEAVKSIPTEDKELLVSLATRQRDVDAEGEHLAGLNKSEKFRRFRKFGEFDPDLAGL